MKKQIKNIRDFQTIIAETPEGYIQSIEDPIKRKNQKDLRKRLLKEEVKELEEAMDKEDIVEVLDAGVDILYIVLGTMHEYGLLDKFEDAWDLVHSNNMSKVWEDGKVYKDGFGKVIKPANFKPVDLKQLF